MSDLPLFLRDVAAPASRGPLVDCTPATARAARRVPGEAGIWVFILGDILMFGLFFAAFLAQRGQDPELFAHSRETMTVGFGAVNTLVLLTSSLFVATAVRAHRAGRRTDARRLVALAGACAATFAAIKVTEWGIKLDAGYAPGDNLFYTYYYVLTAVHFLHLCIGSVVLALFPGQRPLELPCTRPEIVVSSVRVHSHELAWSWALCEPAIRPGRRPKSPLGPDQAQILEATRGLVSR